MEDKIKMAIVGFGRIAELVHLPIIKKTDGISVTGVYDITPQRLQLAAKRGFGTFDNLDALLDSDIDLVLIATPPALHYSIALKALARKKHVLVEKPGAVSLKECEELLEKADMQGCIFSVFYNRRYTPDYKFIRQVIADNRLGDIFFVERRQHMFDRGASFGVNSFNPGWRLKREYGGGALLDWGIHLVDQLLNLNLGKVKAIKSVLGRLPANTDDVEDFVHAHFILENKITLTMNINFQSYARFPAWIIGGSKGTLVQNALTEFMLLEKANGEPERFQIEKPSLQDGKEIYQAIIAAIRKTGTPAVRQNEILNNMQVLQQIMNRNQGV